MPTVHGKMKMTFSQENRDKMLIFKHDTQELPKAKQVTIFTK